MAKVLIVEDSSYMRTTLRNYLTDEGHEVVGEVSDGNHVIRAVQEYKPEIIFLDIILPGLIGLDIIKMIKSKFSDIKVVIISVLEDQSIKQEAIDSGASAYICKPISETSIAKVMTTIQ